LGVNIKIITGDSHIVTRKICEEVGLSIYKNKVVIGDELASLGEKEFESYVHSYNVFARITPEQKFKIVSALNKEGHVVGYLGDGVNDVPALKAADVSITVDTASGIAKDAADIIILNKSLKVVVDGLLEGRKTFGNITKYILNTISANFGNMFTVAFSSLFLKFIPLLPSQILLNNFISDVPLLTISKDNVDKEMLKKPKKWNLDLISKFMIYFGIISTFFDLLLIFALIFFFNVSQEVFRTAWFVESAISEIIVTFSIRTKLPFYKSVPSKLLLITSAGAILLIFWIVYSSFGGSLFEFVILPMEIIWLILLVLALYFIIVEIVKKVFYSKYDL
jgi:Mg2+-importing ATPase